ncbi:transposase [Candidatus Acetothermia bacterium]|nr:transposase [Candidatus Acetothermia bacterium]MCI2428075.1 transposase [Candidatus Acetothermia bacterium]
MSYVVYLREELRLPVNLVQTHLAKAGLHVTRGEIEHILREVAEYLRPTYEEYVNTLQRASAVHLDEKTGRRMEGENDWLWGGVAKDPDTVVFKVDERRCGAVVAEMLGDEFSGVVGSDFYSVTTQPRGKKQRCWAHLLRDTRKLEREEEKGLHEQLKQLWERAASWVVQEQERASPAVRGEQLAAQWEEELFEFAQKEWEDPDCQRIAERLIKHSVEMFTFVTRCEVEETNNRAERALRPLRGEAQDLRRAPLLGGSK